MIYVFGYLCYFFDLIEFFHDLNLLQSLSVVSFCCRLWLQRLVIEDAEITIKEEDLQHVHLIQFDSISNFGKRCQCTFN